MSAGDRFEMVLVGGGLQNGLIALAALHDDPNRRVAMVEPQASLGGNHTWCAHAHDVPAEARSWVGPLFVYRWAGYDVIFPDRQRRLIAPYAAITSERFHEVVRTTVDRAPGCRLFLERAATGVEAHAVTLSDGTRLEADLIVDGRGPLPASDVSHCGFQKFFGLELEFEQPHRLELPILMDATVEQTDGFRFLYCLPFGARRMLIEDTCFSRSAAIDRDGARAAVLDYSKRFGSIGAVVREETGVLPMPWSSREAAPASSPLIAGYRGGWFHPATGYSFPTAVRLACHVGQRRALAVFDEALARLHRAHRAQVRFAQILNRLLFGCFDPKDSWNVFSRFYTLPDEVIHRFYALTLTAIDRVRLLGGRPPRGFSIRKALAIGAMG